KLTPVLSLAYTTEDTTRTKKVAAHANGTSLGIGRDLASNILEICWETRFTTIATTTAENHHPIELIWLVISFMANLPLPTDVLRRWQSHVIDRLPLFLVRTRNRYAVSRVSRLEEMEEKAAALLFPPSPRLCRLWFRGGSHAAPHDLRALRRRAR